MKLILKLGIYQIFFILLFLFLETVGIHSVGAATGAGFLNGMVFYKTMDNHFKRVEMKERLNNV